MNRFNYATNDIHVEHPTSDTLMIDKIRQKLTDGCELHMNIITYSRFTAMLNEYSVYNSVYSWTPNVDRVTLKDGLFGVAFGNIRIMVGHREPLVCRASDHNLIYVVRSPMDVQRSITAIFDIRKPQ